MKQPQINASSAIGAQQALTEVVTAWREYAALRQEHLTDRKKIAAWEQTTLAKIKATEHVLLTHLERSFDERKENFRRLFDTLDQAQATGNTEAIAQTLDSVTQLAQTSPFRDLADVGKVREQLEDPDHDWQM